MKRRRRASIWNDCRAISWSGGHTRSRSQLVDWHRTSSNASAWADSIFNQEEIDIDLATYKPYQATSSTDLLKTFDNKVASCKQVLEGVGDGNMVQPWRLKVMGQLMFEKPRADVFRDFTLSHLIHHRGQFSVYLRLLNIPVPGSYGPSADEQAQRTNTEQG